MCVCVCVRACVRVPVAHSKPIRYKTTCVSTAWISFSELPSYVLKYLHLYKAATEFFGITGSNCVMRFYVYKLQIRSLWIIPAKN